MIELTVDDQLRELIESNCSPETKTLAVALLETRGDLCYLKKMSKWQMRLIASMLITLLASLFVLIGSEI